MDRLLRPSVSFETAIDQCLQVLGFCHKGYSLDEFVIKGLPVSVKVIPIPSDKCN
jgi:hypothetical protein